MHWKRSHENWLTRAIDSKSYSSWEGVAAAFNTQFNEGVSGERIEFRWRGTVRCITGGYTDPFPLDQEIQYLNIPNNHEANLRAIRTADASRSTRYESWTEHQVRWLECNMSSYPYWSWEKRADEYNECMAFSRAAKRTARSLEKKWRAINQGSSGDERMSRDYYDRADRYDGRNDRDSGYEYYD